MAGTLRIDATGASQNCILRRFNPINPAPPPAVLPPVIIDPSTIVAVTDAPRDYSLPAGNYGGFCRMASGPDQNFGSQANPVVITDGNVTTLTLT